jgi:hypothetical protein
MEEVVSIVSALGFRVLKAFENDIGQLIED